MNDLISVIINAYNSEKFIKKCLDSVLNQTYENLEILVINDGSTDKTLDIVKSYKDSRINIITTKNQGLSLSRNTGIDNAKGEYLYFVDADDFIEKDTIEYLYNLCKTYNVDFATTNALVIFDYDYKKKNIKEKIEILNSNTMLKKVLLAEQYTGTSWNKLIKKELYNDIRFENRIINDIVVTYKLVLKTDKIIFSNQKKYYYLKHDSSISTHGYENIERSIDYYNAVKERHSYIKKLYPNMIENDLSLIRGILKLYLIENKEVEEFLKNQQAIKLFKKLYSFKMFFADALFKEKVKMFLFRLSPKLYKKIGTFYRKKYRFKM